MPTATVLDAISELLDVYDTVEDPRRLLDALVEGLVERLGLDAAVLLTPSREMRTGPLLMRTRAASGRAIRLFPGTKNQDILLDDILVAELRRGPLPRSRLSPSNARALWPFSDPFDWVFPIFRRVELEGLLVLSTRGAPTHVVLALDLPVSPRVLASVFLPALVSHRAFRRFLRFEGAMIRQLRVDPGLKLRTPADRIFPRAKNLLGTETMFVVQFDSKEELFHDLATSWNQPALRSLWHRGVGAQGIMGHAVSCETSCLVEGDTAGTYRLGEKRIAALTEEEALLSGRRFALVPIRFERDTVGLFGFEMTLDRAIPNLSEPRTRTFFSTLGRIVFFARVYRSLLEDSHRVDILGWAARRLGEGSFQVDRELIDQTTSHGARENELIDSKNLVDLAIDMRRGLDQLFSSFHRLVAFVDTLYKVGISGLEEGETLQDYLQSVVRIIRDRLGFEKVVALRADPSRQVLQNPVVSWEFESEDQARLISDLEVPYETLTRSVWAWVARNQKELLVPDALAEFTETETGDRVYIRREWIDLFKARSFFTVPLLSRPSSGRTQELLGVISVASHLEGPVQPGDLSVIRAVCRQVALTLENVRLQDEQRVLIASQNRELEKQRQDLRETYFRLFRYEKNEFHLDLTAGLAHDLKNPLIAGRQYLRILDIDLDRWISDVGQKKCVEVSALERLRTESSEHIARVGEMLVQVQDKLKDIERRASEESSPAERRLDPREVLEQALDDIPKASRVGIVFHRDIEEVPKIRAHPDGLRSLFMNLVVNAIEAMTEDCGGDVWISLCRRDQHIIFTVEDNGCGIPQDAIDKIFNARFSTKPRGTGLGLAWVQRNVTQHLGGQIHVESGDLGAGRRTRFTVTLPVHPPSEPEHEAARVDCG